MSTSSKAPVTPLSSICVFCGSSAGVEPDYLSASLALADCIAHMQEQKLTRIEAEAGAEEEWVAHVNEVAGATLFPKGGSWYLGANVEGKPRVFMPYAGGVGAYREVCDAVVEEGYRGFRFA